MRIKVENDKKKTNRRFNILAIICICIFAIGIAPKTLQNDTYYTITLGEYVLNNGIDMMEHFSWHSGLIYTYPHWLYDIFIYLVYNIGGFQGIYFSTIILGMILGISIYVVGSKLSKNNIIALLITILMLYVGKDYIAARAQLVTFILFVWTIYFIEKFLDTKKKRYGVALIAIPIAIANIHAAVFPFYFILYLPYIGEYIIALILGIKNPLVQLFMRFDKLELDRLEKQKKELTEKQLKQKELLQKRIEINQKRIEEKKQKREEKRGKEYKVIIRRRDNVKWLILIMIICAFTGLLTPIGDTPYTYLIHTMQGNTTENISEHLPLTLINNKNAMLVIISYILLLTFTKVKIRLSDLFLAGGLVLLSFMSRRQLSMLYFIGGFVLMRILADFIKIYSSEGEVDEIKYYISTWIGQTISYFIVTIITVCLLWNVKDEQIVNEDSYPVQACDYIIHNLDIENIKLFNDYNYGSYLMYRGIPVFIDSRADVYDPQFNGLEDDIFKDYINISSLSCDYDTKFEHYGITHVMTYSNSKLALYISKDKENYKEIYKDDHFVIFERLIDSN